MTEAYRCDRCGEYGSGEPPNTIDKSNSKDGVPVMGDGLLNGTDDLCESCGKSYRHWMDSET